MRVLDVYETEGYPLIMVKRINGLLSRLYVWTISKVKTVKVNISVSLSLIKMWLFRIRKPTLNLCLTSAVALMILSFLTKPNNSYADEVYSYPRYINRQPLANSFSIVNDWREFSYTYDMTQYDNVDWGSFKLTYGAVDNYGEDFDIWFTIKVSGVHLTVELYMIRVGLNLL